MTLLNKTKNSLILSQMSEAKTLWPRMKGLLGHSSLQESEGLWIHHCNSIHTFGMKFAIDCIFLDSGFRVRKVVQNVKPGRWVWPVWGADSVIEVKAGLSQQKNVQAGDEVHVGS